MVDVPATNSDIPAYIAHLCGSYMWASQFSCSSTSGVWKLSYFFLYVRLELSMYGVVVVYQRLE